jgi:hypothetical protein
LKKGGQRRTEIFESQIFESKSFFRSKNMLKTSYYFGRTIFSQGEDGRISAEKEDFGNPMIKSGTFHKEKAKVG